MARLIADERQLAFAFDFDREIEIAENLKKEDERDDRGEQGATAGFGGASTGPGNNGGSQEVPDASERMEDSRPVGGEFAEGTENARRARADGADLEGYDSGGGREPGFGGSGSSGRSGRGGTVVSTRGEHASRVKQDDFVINDGLRFDQGGPKVRFNDNLSAIEKLRELEASGRKAGIEDQRLLVKYVGWGGLPQAFDESNAAWNNEFSRLQNVLTVEEYESARQSTQDAHYTPIVVVDATYRALERFGVKGGNFLEPALGTGHFIGRMPENMRRQVSVTGIERDSVTARIATHLYPSSSVIEDEFQRVRVPDDAFHVMVGNPPFGEQRVYDPYHQDLSRWSIHNYFIAKSLEKVAPGGVLGFVISRYFLDGENPEIREHIADRAHFLGAVRLPNTAFSDNAMTEVTSDLVFLMKAREGEVPERSWTELRELAVPGVDDGIRVNAWYVNHPEMMLGRMEMVSGRFGPQPALIEEEGRDWRHDLMSAIDRLPENVYREADVCQRQVEQVDVPEGIKVGAFYLLEDDRIAVRMPDELGKTVGQVYVPAKDITGQRIRGLVAVRNALRELMAAEGSVTVSEESLAWMRKELNAVYDKYVKQYGYINGMASKLAMQDDPEYPLLQALEINYDRGLGEEAARKRGEVARPPSAEKAAIFSRRVVSPVPLIERTDTASDGLAVCLNSRGEVDLGYIVDLCGKSPAAVLEELEGRIYKNPVTRRWETREEYLTGNVKRKLKEAETAALMAPEFAINVEALRRVQPEFIKGVDIGVEFGAGWVPEATIRDFVKHLIGDVYQTVMYVPEIGRWTGEIGRGSTTTCTVEWGTAAMPANAIMTRLLKNQPIEVKYLAGTDPKSGAPIYRTDATETAAAEAKAEAIRRAFQEWIWDEPERRQQLETLYNDRFNTNVERRYDGSHLTLPGSSPLVKLRPSQKNAIWRGIVDGSTLFDHEVGAGKTYVMAAVAMEQRRMGLKKKPMITVPNNVLYQMRDAFYALYPNANVLVAEESDFEKSNRQKLFARIATGDWDAVIVPHSSFKKIPLPQHTFVELLVEQIDDLTDAIDRMKAEKGQNLGIKELAKIKDRMKAKLERVGDTSSKDQAVDFADLGVDALLVDELDEFKNLFITTTLTRVSGLGNLEGSEKAFDLFVKARYLQRTYENRGFYGATGTPVSNTIAEVYTLQRYFQYDDLVARGLVHFDAWAKTFGVITTGWELDATGVNYRQHARFAKFQGIPELSAMYRTFADVVTRADLDRQAREAGLRPIAPGIKGGKPTNVIIDRSPLQERYMGVMEQVHDEEGKPLKDSIGRAVKAWNEGSICWRMENMPSDPRVDNPLKVTNDARKAGLDFRLIDPSAEEDPKGKINVAAENIYRIWKEWEERKGTQLVFCDLSTPKGIWKAGGVELRQGDEGGQEEVSMDSIIAGAAAFSVYNQLKTRLVDMGIPEHEIQFIHDADNNRKKARLYADTNEGKVRVLMGSTFKMGAGTNVQRRVVAKHDLDCPWRPRDVTQRDGRALRQGNMFYEEDPEFAIELYRYATKRTYDARMWQTVEVKARAIEQFRSGNTSSRTIEDITTDAANFADIKAAASGNPLVLVQVELASKLRTLEAEWLNHQRNKHRMEERLVSLGGVERRLETIRQRIGWDKELRDTHPVEKAEYTAPDGRVYAADKKKAALYHLVDGIKKAMTASVKRGLGEKPKEFAMGTYRGFGLAVAADHLGNAWITVHGASVHSPENLVYTKEDKIDALGFFRRVDNFLESFESSLKIAEEEALEDIAERARMKEQLEKPFADKRLLELVRNDVEDINRELKCIEEDAGYISTWLPSCIEAPPEMVEAVMQARAAGVGVKEVVGAIELLCADIERSRGDHEKQIAAWISFEERACEDVSLLDNLRDALVERAQEGTVAILAQAISRSPLSSKVPQHVLDAADRVSGIEAALSAAGAKDATFAWHGEAQSYIGAISYLHDKICIQEVGKGERVVHRIADLLDLGQSIEVGAPVRIRYTRNGKAIISTNPVKQELDSRAI